MAHPRRSLEQRFRERTRVDPETGCHVWLGYIDRGGYGYMKYEGKNRRAHRVSYEAAKGKIPFWLDIDHLCRNRACVNPEHLEAVTPYENVVVRGRGFVAENARKTHCKNGHPFDEVNTGRRVYEGKPHRACRTCDRERMRRFRLARRMERSADA